MADHYSREADNKTRCMFSVIRYIPDLVRGEFVNIGIAVRDTESPEQSTIRLTQDWSRVQELDPEADIAMLSALEQEWQTELTRSVDLFDILVQGSSGCIQLTTPKGCLLEEKTAYVERLMQAYVHRTNRTAVEARSFLYTEMRSFLESRGLWREMTTDLPASRYTHPGNPIRIDCGYKTIRKLHCIHAVSVLTDNGDGLKLASTVASLRAGVLRVDGLALDLLAVVESHTPRFSAEQQDRYSFNLDIMTQAGICTVPLGDIANVAARFLSEVA